MDGFVESPVAPPIKPMLAKRRSKLPKDGDGVDYLFEPKWDGFRTVLFKNGSEFLLQSRDRKPLNRYFPELEAPILEQLPERCVLDGELVVVTDRGLDFGSLQLRIHPARSRVELLAEEIPASLVFFDCLALGDDDLRARPFLERRERLEAVLANAEPPLFITPASRDRAVAADWFTRFEGAGFDGVMAKDLAAPYEAGKRTMLKVKHVRTVDCVLAGFRWHKNGPGTLLGSMLLGLYDDKGRLQHVGVAASFTMDKRKALVEELAPLRENALDGHPWADWHKANLGEEAYRKPGMKSRWSSGKTLEWEALRPERVVEVKYGHVQYGRFRHTAHFKRWRPDKAPEECTFEQVEEVAPVELQTIFSGRREV